MLEQTSKIINEFDQEIKNANTSNDIENIRLKYLGKKGLLTVMLKELSNYSLEERKILGEAVNKLKDHIEKTIKQKMYEISTKELNDKLIKEDFDYTLPSTTIEIGNFHPITQVSQEIISIFISMGFFIAEGPEVEDEYYNFEALNVPKHHPARDMQDTFYLENGQLLRTQTSPVQIRVMEKMKPPFKMIALGKVYRRDDDITHSPMFTQLEGLVVGDKISMADLKGTLSEFAEQMFGKRPTRFRPSYFPFTEPSAEMDVQCIFCNGKGCKVCKFSGWMEILGCGMVHTKVFQAVNYDPDKVSGFAFGMGIERITMQRYGIDNIRLLFNSDIRFLRQF